MGSGMAKNGCIKRMFYPRLPQPNYFLYRGTLHSTSIV